MGHTRKERRASKGGRVPPPPNGLGRIGLGGGGAPLLPGGPGGGPPRLLSSRESIHPLSVYGELSLEHRLRFVLNGKMEHLTTHLHRPRTTRSPLSFWGDGGIVPFEPFFHAFPGGLEKAAINRTFLILPSFQEEREILFP